MTRAGGRRSAAPPPTGRRPGQLRLALAGVGVVLLTLAALFAAGASGRATGPRPVPGTHLDLGARTFTCTGGLPGTTASAGSLDGGGHGVAVEGQDLPHPSFRVGQPTRVAADRAVAARAFAVQQSTGPRWLAAEPCPEPRATWWFVGAGASDRHRSEITVANPRPGVAIFDVDVLGPEGPVRAPGLHGLTLAPGAHRTIDLARMAPSDGDVAVRIRTSQGLVAAAAAERWAPGLIGSRTRAWVAAQPASGRDLALLGLPRAHQGSLVVANPAEREAVVKLRVVSTSGTFQPTRHASFTVPAGTVDDVDLSDVLDAKAAAVRLSASVPVTATVRSVSGAAEAYATAAQRLRGTSVAGIPAAGRSRLVLASLGSGPARVTVQVTGRHGQSLHTRHETVDAGAATTLALPAHALAVSVRSGGGDVAAGITTTSSAGLAAVPVAPAVTAQRRPGVLPAW
ncbi:MAG TPA: DUF5719 family protein [Marmoricola sp.]